MYRDFKNFTDFQSDLISESNSRESCTFKKSFVEVLDKHASKKKKILCGNHQPHVNKTLHSAVMKYGYF